LAEDKIIVDFDICNPSVDRMIVGLDYDTHNPSGKELGFDIRYS
jgi:hypothetical protein